MRTGLVLLVFARWSIRLDVQIRRDEPVPRGSSVAIQGFDVESHGPGVRKLRRRVSLGLCGDGRQLTVTKDIRSSSVYRQAAAFCTTSRNRAYQIMVIQKSDVVRREAMRERPGEKKGADHLRGGSKQAARIIEGLGSMASGTRWGQ